MTSNESYSVAIVGEAAHPVSNLHAVFELILIYVVIGYI